MGALVTLELPADSPVQNMPWIITFGPLSDDEEWEPVVCGPYERPHALSIAETVVADEELMAVVEPLLPHVSADEIRGEIAAAKLMVDEPEVVGEVDALDESREDGRHEHREPGEPPTPAEVRAGMARIAAKLTS
ncbi:MAG TPA: hypothetical protein VFC00_02320 [Micromonosporaceae bacterium]|nr:hypothetical protein [Micromonosporaceae bacterium]